MKSQVLCHIPKGETLKKIRNSDSDINVEKGQKKTGKRTRIGKKNDISREPENHKSRSAPARLRGICSSAMKGGGGNS